MRRRLSLAIKMFILALAVIAIRVPAAGQDDSQGDERILWAASKAQAEIGIKLDHPVPIEVFTDKERMKEIMLMFFRQDYPEDKYQAQNALMLKFGFNLFEDESEDEIAKDMMQGILGVYDDKDKKIYLVSSELMHQLEDEHFMECSVKEIAYEDPVLKDWLDKHRVDIVAVHESTHAIQDQNFDLYDIREKLKHNDDAYFAIKTMIEGQAEYVEFKYTLSALKMLDYYEMFYQYGESWDMELFSKVDEMVENSSDDSFGSCENTRTFLWWQSNIPYIFGRIFMTKVKNEKSARATNESFTRCPLSSEQIMNSDKYFEQDKEDRPIFIRFPSFDSLIDTGQWRYLDYNTMGQLKLYLLCRDLYLDPVGVCKPMSEGWDGDRYIVWRNADEDMLIAWYTTWDTADDAREFYDFYIAAHNRKGSSGGDKSTGDNWQRVLDDANSMYMEINGNDVIIIEGPLDEAGFGNFAAQLKTAEKYEATYDICTTKAADFNDSYPGTTGEEKPADESTESTGQPTPEEPEQSTGDSQETTEE